MDGKTGEKKGGEAFWVDPSGKSDKVAEKLAQRQEEAKERRSSRENLKDDLKAAEEKKE